MHRLADTLRVPVFALALAAAAVGCAKPKPHVRVTHVQPFTHKDPTGGKCQPMGEAEGKGTSEAEARADLREQARDVGANTVLIDAPIAKAAGRRTVLHAQLLLCGAAHDEAPPPAAAATEAEAAPSVEERLAEVKRLHEQGLITQEEYDAKRKALLDEL